VRFENTRTATDRNKKSDNVEKDDSEKIAGCGVVQSASRVGVQDHRKAVARVMRGRRE